MHRKKKLFRRFIRYGGLPIFALVAAACVVHYQTHDWYRDGPFRGEDFPVSALSVESSDSMDLYRLGTERYQLKVYSQHDRSIFALFNAGNVPVWARAANRISGEITLPYSREEMGWWGWKIPLGGSDGEGTLFINPLGEWNNFYYGRTE